MSFSYIKKCSAQNFSLPIQASANCNVLARKPFFQKFTCRGKWASTYVKTWRSCLDNYNGAATLLNLLPSIVCVKPPLTLPMLRLLPSKAKGRRIFGKPSKPCHVGIHWIALAENSQTIILVLGFQPFFRILHHFVLAKKATSSVSVKMRASRFIA